jgi:hypothetical protein
MVNTIKMSAVYIGCGLDINTIQSLDSIIHHFIYIDSLPYSENGDIFVKNNIKLRERGYIPVFIHMMYEIGYTLKEIPEWFHKFEKNWGTYITTCISKPNVYKKIVKTPMPIYLSFLKGDTLVECYFNTPFPKISNELLGKIARAKYLIAIGHHPHFSILDMMDKFTLVGNTSTCYHYQKDQEDDGCIDYLYRHPSYQTKIQNILILHKDIIKVTTFTQLLSDIKMIVNNYGMDSVYQYDWDFLIGMKCTISDHLKNTSIKSRKL